MSLTFTMTTGRRLELFRRTMDSFLANCEDQDMICRWLVSDDRSSQADLAAIREAYPFLEIHNSPRPGQAANLNFLFALVTTPMFLHWEDDWLTVKKGHFIRDALAVHNSDDRIRNVLFRGWDGVHIRHGDTSYIGHYFDETARKARGEATDCWWYGYSLNPSLQFLDTVQRIGRYPENVDSRYFDRPPAIKYRALGLLRASLPDKWVEHIGEDQPAWEL